jgi:hypothetical protein
VALGWIFVVNIGKYFSVDTVDIERLLSEVTLYNATSYDITQNHGGVLAGRKNNNNSGDI